VFYAGRATDDDSVGAAGVMIVETWTPTRRFRVLYMRGVHPEGRFRNGEAAAQTGLLHGLRACQRRGWHHVHVVGDNAKAHRQLSTRTAPKEKSQQATFWTARRTADAIGVATRGLHPRERNRASRSLMLPGNLSGQEEELTSQTRRRGVESMDPIMATMSRDITHWWEHHNTQEPVGSADGTV
jgi:ribonuclease HI